MEFILWIPLSDAEAIQGRADLFWKKRTLNTCHCQTSCNLRHQTTGVSRRNASDENTIVRLWLLVSSGLGQSNIKIPLTAALRWTRGDPAISKEFKFDMFWKYVTASYLRHRFETSQLYKVQQFEVTWLWQHLVSFIQIHCNWLHPGGTPGSNILIKLICEILTMWVFRWLIIWCERSLCFHWKDTGGAGTCFSKTLQKIIAVELSWEQAITNDSVCLFPQGTQFLHHPVFFPVFCDGLSKYFSPVFFPQQFATVAPQLSSTWLWWNVFLRKREGQRCFSLFPDVLFSSRARIHRVLSSHNQSWSETVYLHMCWLLIKAYLCLLPLLQLKNYSHYNY